MLLPGMPDNPNYAVIHTRHRFAYVDFSTPEAKASAITLSEQPLIGRKLLIKDGTYPTTSYDLPLTTDLLLR